MLSEHAERAPSSAEQWGNCTGFVHMLPHVPPRPEHPRTRGGTASHWVMERVLNAWTGREPGHLLCSDYIGTAAPNGVVVDEEMAAGAQVLVDDVLAVCQQYGALRSLEVEYRVSVPSIHPSVWGTLDVALWLPTVGKLYTWEYKFGHGRVGAIGNLQGVCYMRGIADAIGIDGHDEMSVAFEFRVVQPYCYQNPDEVTTWRGMLSDLRPYVNMLYDAANATTPTLTTGKHCRYCPALHACSAGRENIYRLIDVVQAPVSVDVMTPDEMGIEYEILERSFKVYEQRLKELAEVITHDVKSGGTKSGYALEAVKGRENWAVPPGEVLALARQFGVDASAGKVKTPNQVLNACAPELRPMLASVLDNFTTRSSKTELVKRNETRAARAFKTMKGL